MSFDLGSLLFLLFDLNFFLNQIVDNYVCFIGIAMGGIGQSLPIVAETGCGICANPLRNFVWDR